MAEPTTDVLIVDDDEDIRDSVQSILQLHGWTTATAADGAEALAWLRREGPPRLILLDLMMPGMNGIEFRHEQLRDPALAAVPAVGLTGAASFALDDTALAGLRVVRKPFEMSTLLDLVTESCRR